MLPHRSDSRGLTRRTAPITVADLDLERDGETSEKTDQ
jgi:hypothetical protein